MPGWQVAIYDKRHEVLKKHKVHWPRIWNGLREHEGKPPLDFSDPAASRIWRFEFRAGKRRLKQFKIRTWADFDERVGDLLAMAASIVRYRQPNNDSNRSRWPQHPIWTLVQEALAKGLGATRSGATPSDIREVYREEQRRLLTQQIEGLAVNLAALDGCTTAEEVSTNTAKVLRASLLGMARHRTPLLDRLERAAERYVFL